MRMLFKRGFRPVICLILFCLLVFTLTPPSVHAMPVFINELHYDNAGADVGEGVELAGLAGTNLQGWRLWFYNGSNGSSYASLGLNGVIPDQQNGYGVLGFSFAGIQNGSPDGVALVDASNQLQQFISYEGVFTALSGVAANTLSEDIGIAESPQSVVGISLQLTGNAIGQFQWREGVSSFGSINSGQQFSALRLTQGTVSIVPSWVLLALGLAGFVINERKEKKGIVV